MARIRTVKPEFWSDGKNVNLSPLARLLFIGAWNFALCDDGHLPDDSMGLKLKVLPADDVDPNELLDELLMSGQVVRGTTPDGRSYLHIPRLRDHQKVDGRWTPRCFVCSQDPAKTQPASPKPAETRASSSEARRDSPQERKGKERKGTTTSADAERFDEFWTLYPRKIAKPAALKAWKAAVKRATADEILRGLERTQFRDDPQFVPHPATWLRQDRWADEAEPLRLVPDDRPLTAEQVAAVLGPDRWTPPPPPADLGPDEGWEWTRQQRLDRIAERQRLARERLREGIA